jgi:predicted RNase H-like HicB family nuclease
MRYNYEVEVLPNDDGYNEVSIIDFDGFTQGIGYDDALVMAADWLSTRIADYLEQHKKLPLATHGNKPKHDGQVVLVSVDVDISNNIAPTRLRSPKQKKIAAVA